MLDGEPFRAHEAKRRIRTILIDGLVNYDVKHFRDEAAKDSIEMPDVVNVLRAGIVDEPEFENGAWRYRIRTQKFLVVVEFEADDELTVITVWRLKS